MNEILKALRFDKNGLAPAVIQDYRSKKVLTLCYMNREALRRTLEEGKVYVYRRSKGRLMMKGQTSGCVQTVRSIDIDCEGNSILLRVAQKVAACHDGYFTCYFRRLSKDGRFKVAERRVFDPSRMYGERRKQCSIHRKKSS
jgi:phosphoribosyl-AMP cyclohydrolase